MEWADPVCRLAHDAIPAGILRVHLLVARRGGARPPLARHASLSCPTSRRTPLGSREATPQGFGTTRRLLLSSEHDGHCMELAVRTPPALKHGSQHRGGAPL